MEQKTILKFKIKNLDIAQSYFKGQAEMDGKNYPLNLQGHSSDKIIKLPFVMPKGKSVVIRVSGPSGISIEDTVHFKGTSEWIEIDSTYVLHYVADNQDEFDSLEILLESA